MPNMGQKGAEIPTRDHLESPACNWNLDASPHAETMPPGFAYPSHSMLDSASQLAQYIVWIST